MYRQIGQADAVDILTYLRGRCRPSRASKPLQIEGQIWPGPCVLCWEHRRP
jgi:hypothetical protein